MFSEIHVVVRGKVQRVGYRDFVDQYARTHELHGWIRNNEDGSVEMVIQGTPEELKACTEVLNQGSSLARVDSIAIDWRTPEVHFEEFSVVA